MKHNYKTMKRCIVGLVLIATQASAQISGVVTINSASATAGTNYQSFNALATALNTSGISGPLTVNVTAGSGPYNEQVIFNQIAGMSATSTITINGNGCTISFNSSASATPHTIQLNGTDYMYINNLTVVGLGATYALACHLWNSANNNVFTACTFSVPLNGTSTTQVPFSLSGTQTSGTSTGPSGNNNVVMSCTMTGGYYNTTIVGNSTTPFNTGNQVVNSYIRDFYLYGFYNYYCQNTLCKNNVVDRTLRSTVSTGYGIYLTTGSLNTLVDGNHIRRMNDGVTGGSSSIYAVYIAASASLNNENIIRNNIVSDNKSTIGTIAGIYNPGYTFNNVYHNTIVIDDQTATSSSTYGLYCLASNNNFRNNIVYINRAGSGSKYCIYISSGLTQIQSDYNVLNMITTAGTPILGYYGNNYLNLASWQNNTGFDAHSVSTDPVFTNTATMNYAPTALAINNMCLPVNDPIDFYNAGRSPLSPDPGAIEFYNTPCSSVPANSFVTPTVALCPGATTSFSLVATSSYTNGGYMVSWQQSTTSVVGPFTAVPTGTLNIFTTSPIYMTTYYNAVITCTNNNTSYTTTTGQLFVAQTTTNSVPYYEGFESMSLNHLPNCSWSSSSPGGATVTYTTTNSGNRVPHNGTNFASFSSSPSGTNYYYTNGILLKPGITYSASLWFITDLNINYVNWADLSILVGQSQSPLGLQPIASTNGTLSPVLYTQLSNTFNVQTAGLYYIAVRATSTANVAPYLSWDDLSVTIPCDQNPHPMQLSTSASNICAGQSAIISAVGASSYSWSTGQTSSTISVAPANTTTYTAMGTSSLTGCTKTITQVISVKPSPQIVATADRTVICMGGVANLAAFGNVGAFYWSNGVSAPSITVSPAATAGYTVAGIGSNGCSGQSTISVVVNPLPGVSASPVNTVVCMGQPFMLSASGASSYQWYKGPANIQLGSIIATSVDASTTYTVLGTDDNGCVGIAYVNVAADACTGIATIAGSSNAIRVSPNPGSGVFTIETGNASVKTIEVSDISGRVVFAGTTKDERAQLDLSSFANGVYCIKVSSESNSGVAKVIKN